MNLDDLEDLRAALNITVEAQPIGHLVTALRLTCPRCTVTRIVGDGRPVRLGDVINEALDHRCQS